MISNEEALRDANRKLPISSQLFCAILGTTTLGFGLSALLAGPAHGYPFHSVSLILLFGAFGLLGYDLATSYRPIEDAVPLIPSRSKITVPIILIFIALIVGPVAAGGYGLYSHIESAGRRAEAARSAPTADARVSRRQVERGRNGRFLFLLETTEPSKQSWFAAMPKEFNDLKDGQTIKVYVTDDRLIPVALTEDTHYFLSLFFFSLPLISIAYYGFLRKRLLKLTGRRTRGSRVV